MDKLNISPEQKKELEDLLDQVADVINESMALDEEAKKSALNLVALVAAKPTPNDINALSVIMDEIGETEKYLAAQELLASLS